MKPMECGVAIADIEANKTNREHVADGERAGYGSWAPRRLGYRRRPRIESPTRASGRLFLRPETGRARSRGYVFRRVYGK